jgi:hypothetical protein
MQIRFALVKITLLSGAFSLMSGSVQAACLFGNHLMEMARMRDLKRSSAREIKKLRKDSLLEKQLKVLNSDFLESEGDDVLALYDQGLVEISQVRSKSNRQNYTLIIGWQGDTVTGGVFKRNTTELMARVRDGGLECVDSKELLVKDSKNIFQNIPAMASTLPDDGYALFGGSLLQLQRYENFIIKFVKSFRDYDSEAKEFVSFEEYSMKDVYTGKVYRLELSYTDTNSKNSKKEGVLGKTLRSGYITEIDGVASKNGKKVATVLPSGKIESDENFESYNKLPWFYVN